MTALEEIIFRAYSQANNLVRAPAFGGGETKYVLPGTQEAKTRQEITGSDNYAGFVDGIQEKPNRYEGASLTDTVNSQRQYSEGHALGLLARGRALF